MLNVYYPLLFLGTIDYVMLTNTTNYGVELIETSKGFRSLTVLFCDEFK